MMSGRRVLMALIGIVCVTAALPPAVAWTLNQRRVADTRDRVETTAGRVGPLVDLLRASDAVPDVVCGPGRPPEARADLPSVTHDEWIAATTPVPSGPGIQDQNWPTDAWGRCLLINVGAAVDREHVWILSSGPNGTVETPLSGVALAGDDIGAVVK